MSGMKSWSTTPANNVLANTGFTMDEGQAPSTLNDSIRQAMADIRTEWAQGANIASAATVDLSTATGGYVTITGSTGPITSFGTVSAGIRRKLLFTGTPTIAHNAASLISPTGGNIVVVAGDTCEVMSEGSGNWRVLWYAGQTGQATSVVTPLLNSTAGINYNIASGNTHIWQINSANVLQLNASGFAPSTDNTLANGSASLRWSGVFTPIIDTGTTGSGTLKTNNGTTVLTWKNDTSVDIAGGLNPGFTSAETAIAVAGTATNIAHGLGVVPRTYMVTMRNKTAELGYSIGDEAPVWAGAALICADATSITIN